MMKIMFYNPEFCNSLANSEFLYSFDYRSIDITDPWVIRILKEVDKVEPLAPNVFRIIGKTWSVDYYGLSTGCKAMLMLYHEHDFVLDLCEVGSNCTKIIADLSLEKNFTVEYHNESISFTGFRVDALCLNDNKEFSDGREMMINSEKYEYAFYDWLDEVVEDAERMEEIWRNEG